MKASPIPQYLKDYAHDLTSVRVEINRARYAGTNKQRSGTRYSCLFDGQVDREYYTDYVGILGELLVRHYYETNPEYSSYEVSTFIKKTGLVKDDVDLSATKNGLRQKISIKAGEGSMKFNKSALEREDSQVIVFIVFTSPTTYKVAHYTPDEVKEWEVKFAYTPYYNKDL